MQNSVLDIALFVIDEYNHHVDTVFPFYDKDFDISAEDFYITESKLVMLLLIIQAFNYKIRNEKLFFEHIYISSVGNNFFIGELKRIYEPLVARKNQMLCFVKNEYYIPKQLNESTKHIIRDMLGTFGGYEEWWLKSEIFNFRSTKEAIENGTFCYNDWQLVVEDVEKFLKRENKEW